MRRRERTGRGHTARRFRAAHGRLTAGFRAAYCRLTAGFRAAHCRLRAGFRGAHGWLSGTMRAQCAVAGRGRGTGDRSYSSAWAPAALIVSTHGPKVSSWAR